MREIPIAELNRYINPWNMEEDCAIAIASDGSRTNGLTIGWAGFGVLWNKPMATVYIHKSRWSKEVFDGADAFSICFLKPEDHNVVDYFGRVSGRDEDKMAGCGMAQVTDDVAPYLAGSRVVILCRIMGQTDFTADSCPKGVAAWYRRSGVHTQYCGEIVRVLVDE